MTEGIKYITPEMLKLCIVTKVKMFFLVLVYVFNFDLFKFSAAILEKGLLKKNTCRGSRSPDNAECGHFSLLFCRGRQRTREEMYQARIIRG